jgi:hypothetical protein
MYICIDGNTSTQAYLDDGVTRAHIDPLYNLGVECILSIWLSISVW